METSKAQMESSKVVLEMAQKKLNDATVTAPMTGIISSKKINVGDMASSQSSAFTLINTDKVEIPIQEQNKYFKNKFKHDGRCYNIGKRRSFQGVCI